MKNKRLTKQKLIDIGFVHNRQLWQKSIKSTVVDGDVLLDLWSPVGVDKFYFLDLFEIKYEHQLENLLSLGNEQ